MKLVTKAVTWHRTLKQVYLSGLKRQRADVVIHILWDMVVPDIMQDHVRVVAGFENRRHNKAERKRWQQAYGLSEDQASSMILEQRPDSIIVASFANDEDSRQSYVVQLNNGSICKHMFLVNRVEQIGFDRAVHLQNQPLGNPITPQEPTVADAIRNCEEELRQLQQVTLRENDYDIGAIPHLNAATELMRNARNTLRRWRRANVALEGRQLRF
ncbi:hypothetical protein EC973_000282 [Apophysomyces ossiformis]|uniref:Uncharacterized protein n=1 Tax=Apophysomyces ossiformis TaxID=679940 RepID=A0A8H7EN75_9FUNG|nr:hypothetical protein EC973_000282 [Apophysomyces ossiformis]